MKSLHLNWIRNIDKSLVIPTVIFSSTINVGGWYRPPDRSQIYVDGHYYDSCFGIIVVNATQPEEFAGTIAHEWRHHWQAYHGWKFDGMSGASLIDLINSAGYNKAIRKYFAESKSEMDALRFQYKYGGIYKAWEELLYDYFL